MLRAAAVQLLAELDSYEAEIKQMLASAVDANLYRLNGNRFDQMRALAGQLPQVYVCWVEVLISRVELVEALWAKAEAKASARKLALLHDNHSGSLHTLRELCLAAAAP